MPIAKSWLFALVLSAWAVLFLRYRRVTNHIDRYEGMILRPLSISVDLLGLYYCVQMSWWPAAVALFWGLFLIGGVVGGATLRADRSFGELANPPAPRTGRDIEALSDEDSRKMGKAVLKLTWLSFIPVFLLLLHHNVKWYYAVLGSFAVCAIIGPVFALLSMWPVALAAKKQRET